MGAEWSPTWPSPLGLPAHRVPALWHFHGMLPYQTSPTSLIAFSFFFSEEPPQQQCAFIDCSIASSPEMAGTGYTHIILRAVLSGSPAISFFFYSFHFHLLLPLLCMWAYFTLSYPFFFSIPDHLPGEICVSKHLEVRRPHCGPIQPHPFRYSVTLFLWSWSGTYSRRKWSHNQLRGERKRCCVTWPSNT